MIQKIKLDDIRIRLFDENQTIIPYKIENTPHYKLLNGDRKPYDVYYKRMVDFGRAKSNYMNSEQYLDFFDEFTYLEAPYENDYISVKKVGNRFDSIDGDHRLSSLKRMLDLYNLVQIMLIYRNLLTVRFLIGRLDASHLVIGKPLLPIVARQCLVLLIEDISLLYL